MIFNLAPKTFLFIMSQRKFKHGKQKLKAEVQQMADILYRQEKAFRKDRINDNSDSQIGTNVAEESKSGLDFSGS
jgi:hypothetical protein